MRRAGLRSPETFSQTTDVVPVSRFVDRVHHLRERSVEKPKVLGFNPAGTFLDYAEFRVGTNKATAEQRISGRLLLNLRSFRKEMTGEPDTDQIATRVSWQVGQSNRPEILFQNPQYIKGQNIEQMFSQSIQYLDGYQKWRYDLENRQIFRIFRKVSEVFSAIEHSENPQYICQQLQELPDSQRFVSQRWFFSTEHEDQPEISLALLNMFPELKQEKEKQRGNDKGIEILMGPPVITASVPSPIHTEGRTSLAWASRLIYIPLINEFVIIQNGLFTAYSKEEIVRFLAFSQQEELWGQLKQQNEEELLLLLNVLPPEFTSMHGMALLHHIVESELGYFRIVPPVDGNIRTGEMAFWSHVDYMLAIFDWEYERCLKQPKLLDTVEERINLWKEMIEHKIGWRDNVDVQSMLAEYTQMFAKPDRFKNTEEMKEEFVTRVLKHYDAFNIKIDLSLLDCVGTSIIGGYRYLTPVQLDAVMGKGTFKWLNEKILHDFTGREELEKFCKKFGIDPKLFAENKGRTCPGCKKVTKYMGPCICPACHAKHQLHMDPHGQENPQELSGLEKGHETSGYDSYEMKEEAQTNFSDLIASIASKSVLRPTHHSFSLN